MGFIDDLFRILAHQFGELPELARFVVAAVAGKVAGDNLLLALTGVVVGTAGWWWWQTRSGPPGRPSEPWTGARPHQSLAGGGQAPAAVLADVQPLLKPEPKPVISRPPSRTRPKKTTSAPVLSAIESEVAAAATHGVASRRRAPASRTAESPRPQQPAAEAAQPDDGDSRPEPKKRRSSRSRPLGGAD